MGIEEETHVNLCIRIVRKLSDKRTGSKLALGYLCSFTPCFCVHKNQFAPYTYED
ncbi:hypothetical protein SH2C18_52200 [Clostridium sediminicola]